jgi:hypothetical protein
MIRRVRYAVLAFVVLGVLGIGVAVDWSSPSRAPVPAIRLQAAPQQETSGKSAPAATVKRPYGGRDLSRIQLPAVVRSTPRVQSGPTPVSSGAGSSGSSSEPDDEPANSSGPTPASSPGNQDADDDGPDRPRPNPPATPTTPTTPGTTETTGTGGTPAPPPSPAPAGDDDDDDDDDDGGGDDDDDDDDGDDD